jgi:hypothetical protein
MPAFPWTLTRGPSTDPSASSRTADWPAPSRSSALPERAGAIVDERVLRAHSHVGDAARIRAAAGLYEGLSAVDVRSRSVEMELHQRQGAADFETVRDAVAAKDGECISSNAQRERLDVIRSGLVRELVGSGHERTVPQWAAVEFVVRGGGSRRAERQMTASARRRTLDIEGAEALADARHRSELGIQTIDKAARRRSDRCTREVYEQRARNRVPGGGGRGLILLKVRPQSTGRDVLVRDEKRDDVLGSGLTPGRHNSARRNRETRDRHDDEFFAMHQRLCSMTLPATTVPSGCCRPRTVTVS